MTLYCAYANQQLVNVERDIVRDNYLRAFLNPLIGTGIRLLLALRQSALQALC